MTDTILATAKQGSNIQIQDIFTSQVLKRLEIGDNITLLGISADKGFLAVGTLNKDIEIWDLNSNLHLYQLEDLYPILKIAWNPSGHELASVSGDKLIVDGNNRIHIWDTTLGKKLFTFEVDSSMEIDPESITWNPNGQMLAASGRPQANELEWHGRTWIWDISEGQLLGSLDFPAPVTSIAWSPDGTMLAIGSTDGYVRVWHTSDIIENSR